MNRVLLCIRRLSGSLLAEARAACSALDLQAHDWPGGVPRKPAAVLISALAARERKVPEELCAMLEAMPGLRLVLCADEPLVQPRVVLGDRVTLLSPPISAEAIALALATSVDAEPVAPLAQRFEVLRRSHWVAWSRGRGGPPISLYETHGATVVVGDAPDPAALAELFQTSPGDAQLEASLDQAGGSAAIAHLTPASREWVLYWPAPQPLWLCSRHRLPTRWDAADAMSTAGRRLIRIPAHPDDQLVAAWSDAAMPSGVLAPLENTVVDGGSETIVGMTALTEHIESLTGLVMEVR